MNERPIVDEVRHQLADARRKIARLERVNRRQLGIIAALFRRSRAAERALRDRIDSAPRG
jgi:hypothetical protein